MASGDDNCRRKDGRRIRRLEKMKMKVAKARGNGHLRYSIGGRKHPPGFYGITIT
jgi:hypothetical protein